jgi:hypothetical protein
MTTENSPTFTRNLNVVKSDRDSQKESSIIRKRSEKNDPKRMKQEETVKREI